MGTVKEKMFLIVPLQEFEVYKNGSFVGCIRRESAFFKRRYDIDFNDWSAEGNALGKEYEVYLNGTFVARLSKKLFKWTDTYEIEVVRNEDALDALLLAAAIYERVSGK